MTNKCFCLEESTEKAPIYRSLNALNLPSFSLGETVLLIWILNS